MRFSDMYFFNHLERVAVSKMCLKDERAAKIQETALWRDEVFEDHAFCSFAAFVRIFLRM